MGKASRHKHERHERLLGRIDPDSLRANNPEGIKISPSLVELIDPYTDENTSLEELKVLVSAGTLAWNLAILPEAARDEGMEQIIEEIEDEGAELFVTLIEELTERKLALFPDDLRVITGWDVRKKNGQHFVMVSAIVDVPGGQSLH